MSTSSQNLLDMEEVEKCGCKQQENKSTEKAQK